MSKLSERLWVGQQLSGRPRNWDDIITSGRCDLDILEDGKLKELFETFLNIESLINKKLLEYDYEVG